MIDTLPGNLNVKQVRQLYPRAAVLRWHAPSKQWYVFHTVEAAEGHHTSEGPRDQTPKPMLVGKRSW